MSGLSHTSLPENFQAETESKLLAQPEPQFLHAQLVKAALQTSLAPEGADPNGRSVMDAGADYSSADRDRLMLQAKPIFTEAFAGKVEFQKRKGDVIRLNRPKFTNSSYTLASRTLVSGQTISTTPMVPDSEQVEMKLLRLAGPHNGTAVTPYGVESFDAQMGIHQSRSIISTHLQRDFDKTLDTIARTILDGGANTIYPLGMSSDDSATSAGQYPLTYEQITRTARKMDELHLPKFSTGRRALVVTATGKRQLKDDPQFARYADFFRDKNPLFPGWFASCDDFDIFLSETLAKTANSSSVPIHQGQAFAPGALGVGMGRQPKVVASSNDNYGETKMLIWIGDMCFKLFDNRFALTVAHTNDEA